MKLLRAFIALFVASSIHAQLATFWNITENQLNIMALQDELIEDHPGVAPTRNLQPMFRYLVLVDGNGHVDLGRGRLAHGNQVNDVELPTGMAQQVRDEAHTLGILEPDFLVCIGDCPVVAVLAKDMAG